LEKFDKETIETIEDTILTRLPDILPYVLEKVNDEGKLRGLLELLSLDELINQLEAFTSKALPTGKILVFAAQNVSTKDLVGVAKNLGIGKDKLEFYNYKEAKTYNYRKLEYNSNVCAVLFGAVPHKTAGTEDYSSVITSLKEKAEKGIIYAKVATLSTGNELKLTKTTFKNSLENLISEGHIKAS